VQMDVFAAKRYVSRLRHLSLVLPLLCLWQTAIAMAGGDLAFWVASDTHFGSEDAESRNRRLIEQANALPGVAYPSSVGGRVERPRGMLMLGDMTDWGEKGQWEQFVRAYGLNGKDGLLRYPVYETIGNHDLVGNSPVREGICRRHGTLPYAWEWEGVRFICLGLYPGEEELGFLRKELKAAGKQQPLVLLFHYAIEGPYSTDWTEREKDAFGETIAGYNVIAIFHGHYHLAGNYVWRGFNVFRPGSPRHASHTFLAVRLTADRLTVCVWNWDQGKWVDGTMAVAVKRP